MLAILERSATKTRMDAIQAQIGELQRELQALRGAKPPRLILPELHAVNGRIDAAKVAEFMAVPLKRLSEGLGLNYKAVHRNPSSEAFQPALYPVKRSLEYLHDCFSTKQVIRAWLNTPHPMLENHTSLETILEGKAYAVERLVGNAMEGVFS